MQDVFTTANVMDRYQCERHTAVAIIQKAIGFKVAGKWFVREANLKRWEDAQHVYPVPTRGRRRKA